MTCQGRRETWGVRRKLLRWSAILGMVCLLPGSAANFAQVKTSTSLMSLVTARAGLIIEVDDLDRHAQTFLDGPLGQRLAAFPPLEQWRARQGQELNRVSLEVKRQIGVSLHDALHRLLGEQLLLAVWPEQIQPALPAQALLLAQTSDGELLRRVLAQLSTAQTKAGMQTSTLELTQARQTISLTVIHAESRTLYLGSIDSLALLATSEQLVRSVLDLRAHAAGSDSSSATERAFQLGRAQTASDAALRLLVSPRPWDELLRADVEAAERSGQAEPADREQGGTDQARRQRAVFQAWQAVDYIGAAVLVGERVSAELHVGWRGADLPRDGRSLFSSTSGKARFLEHVPGNAFAAVAGRLDLGRLVRQGALRLDTPSGSGGSRLGGIAISTLLSGLGPDAGAYLSVAPSEMKEPAGRIFQGAVPVEWTVGLGTQPLDPSRSTDPLSVTLGPVLRLLMHLGVRQANADAGQPISTVVTEDDHGRQMTTATFLNGQGQRLGISLGVSGEYLWASTASEVLQRALGETTADSLAASPAFQSLLNPRLGDAGYVAYFNLASIRRVLESSPQLVDVVVAEDRRSRENVQRSLGELISLLKLADVVLAEARLDESGLGLSVGLSAGPGE